MEEGRVRSMMNESMILSTHKKKCLLDPRRITGKALNEAK